METKSTLIGSLIERIEEYSKTSLELLKLKTLDKAANVTSSLFSRLFLIVVLLFSVLSLNIAISLWIGEILGKDYYGFLTVAAIYFVIGIILFFIHPWIKNRISNSIIKQILN